MKTKLLLISLIFSCIAVNAQDYEARKNKGRIFASYGVNRTSYDLSKLKMKGEGYNIELTNFDANDGFSEIDFSKFNAKLGYFITKNVAIVLGYDNFTYQQVDNRLVNIGGAITDTNGGFNGNYQSNLDVIRTNNDFMSYGYANLNYINLNLEIHDDFWISKNGKFAWSYYFGLGGGIVMSESTVSLFGQESVTTDNGMNGFGGNLSFGTKLHFGPIFLDLGGKAGYINTKDVALDENGGLGNHTFLFASGIASVGLSFNLSK